MKFNHLPKIELHLHLDCSMSYDVVKKFRPNISRDTFKKEFTAPAKCRDLADYLTRAHKQIELMQTEEQLRSVVFDLFEQLHDDYVIYVEIRFAPLEHTKGVLNGVQVVDIVDRAFDDASAKYDIIGGIILCTLRHYSETESLETVKLAEKFYDRNVCGFDIAADEDFPIQNHVASFNYAHSKGISCTAHGGEARGAESVKEILEQLKPQRVGHGVRGFEDQSVIQTILKEDIHLEICPTSNIQTDVFSEIYDHNIDQIFKKGISLSVNTDSRTITPVTLSHEYELLFAVFGWDKEHLIKCNLEAIKHAFTTTETKKELKERIIEGWAE